MHQGMNALVALETECRGSKREAKIAELCGRFYTCIPHASARNEKLRAAIHPSQFHVCDYRDYIVFSANAMWLSCCSDLLGRT